MKRACLLVIFCIPLIASAQNNPELVSVFPTTVDFLNHESTEYLLETRTEGDSYFTMKDLLDPQSKKKIKRGTSSWMIKRGEDYYFNLIYTDDTMNSFFIRLDIIGRYCAAVLDKDMFNKAKADVNNYPFASFGAMGSGMWALSNNLVGWNRSLRDTTDSKKYIILINTDERFPKSFPRNDGSVGNLLTRKKVAQFMENNNMSGEAKNLSFEQVIDLIKKENAKFE